MFKIPWHNQRYDFSIFRIIGGDLPPRDNPGVRFEILNFILNNEKQFKNTYKMWILNAIFDVGYKQKIEQLLSQYGQSFVSVPFDKERYSAAKNNAKKILEAIPINKARNLAIQTGKKNSRFVVVLDSDCFFDEDNWYKLVNEIKKDQKINNRKYYSIPSVRSSLNRLYTPPDKSQASEPLVVFRSDSNMRFNETIPFGSCDKLELLKRLGFNKENILVHENLCKKVGLVRHISTGPDEIECNITKRHLVRMRSLDKLLFNIDAICSDSH